jgi:hypothetical protein
VPAEAVAGTTAVAGAAATLLVMSTAAVTATAAVGITTMTAVAGVERELMIDCHVTRHVSSLLGITGDPTAEMIVAERIGSDIDNSVCVTKHYVQ